MLQQEYISIPPQATEQQHQTPTESEETSHQSGAHGIADKKVKDEADRVRHSLVAEILAFNQASEASGASTTDSLEDEASNSAYSVSNPIKMADTAGLKVGSVIKYTVTGTDSEGRFEI